MHISLLVYHNHPLHYTVHVFFYLGVFCTTALVAKYNHSVSFKVGAQIKLNSSYFSYTSCKLIKSKISIWLVYVAFQMCSHYRKSHSLKFSPLLSIVILCLQELLSNRWKVQLYSLCDRKHYIRGVYIEDKSWENCNKTLCIRV